MFQFSSKDKVLKKQSGFTLLELLVVIGILGVSAGFIYPEIGKWKTKRNIEQDFNTVVSAINYLKIKTRAVNGTGSLNCDNARYWAGKYIAPQLFYDISTQRNDGDGFIMHPDNLRNRIEVNSARDWSDDDYKGETTELYNLLTGKVNVECNHYRTIFNAGGNAGEVGSGDALEVMINYKVGDDSYGASVDGVVDYVNYNAYKVKVNTATAFVQKYKWDLATGDWRELN